MEGGGQRRTIEVPQAFTNSKLRRRVNRGVGEKAGRVMSKAEGGRATDGGRREGHGHGGEERARGRARKSRQVRRKCGSQVNC